MIQPRRQILVFGYHKTGTVLFEQIMRKIGERLDLRIAKHFGLVPRLNPGPDIILLPHSLLACAPERPFRAVRIVRDPRDIWVSGYLYHRRCREDWCINTNFDPSPPILYPKVDFSFQHRSEDWKRDYLARLGGISYQQNLLERDQDKGLAFELDGYTSCTFDAMRAWALTGPDVMTEKLENVSAAFEETMRLIFTHLGFDEAECESAVEMAASEDVNRMDDSAIAANPHIHSRELSKWRQILTPEQRTECERRHGDLITALGYTLGS